jgi:cytochrome P450
VGKVATDDAAYSSDHDPAGNRGGYRGVGVPVSSGTRSIPQEVDPPEFFRYRRLLSPWFSATASAAWGPWLTRLADALLDERIETGKLDFIGDFGFPLPACFVVAWLGLPVRDWQELIYPFHNLVAARPGSRERDEASRRLVDVLVLLRQTIAERRVSPRADLISQLTCGLTDEEVVSVCQLLLFGGADSTTALLGRVLHWLGAHPDQRHRLVDDPHMMNNATEEFLRYFSPIHFNGRTVTRDTELGGCLLRAGDRVLISWVGANHDATVVEAPGEVRLDRERVRHVAFGVGIHRCLGAHFARLMFTIMLTAVLTRMPDYRVIESAAVDYPSIGQVNGFASLLAEFPPARRVGPGLATALHAPTGLAVSR